MTDRIIISQLGYKSPPNWTQLDSFDKYNEFVQKARDKGNKKGLTIAEWELEIFERR